VILGKAIKALEQQPCEDAALKDIFCMGCECKEQEPCRETDDYENEISDLHNRLDIAEYDKERLREEVTTLEEKLKGLSAEPCDDVISRQAVIDTTICDGISCNECSFNTCEDGQAGCLLKERVDKLPPVTPQPKTGHWFIDERPESDRETICSNCEQPIFKYRKLDFDYRPKDCPNCGTKMVEPHESEGK
jgi:hypothetical protein